MKELNLKPKIDPQAGIAAIPVPVNSTVEAATLEGLSTLGIPLIQNLAKLYSPNVILPIIKDLGDDLRKYCHLLRPTVAEEPQFWNMASRMLRGIQQGIVETLRAEGNDFLNDQEDESSYLVRIFTEDPNALAANLTNLLARSNEVEGRTFRVFKCGLSQQEAGRRFSKISEDQLQNALAFGYRKRSYNTQPEIFRNDHQSYLGFGINRGGRYKTEPVLDKNEAHQIRYDRKCKTDFVAYHPDLNLLFVWCHAPNDAPMYAEAVSTAIGKPMAFVQPQQFDLSPFLNRQLGSELLKVAHAVQLMRLEIRRFIVVGSNKLESKLSARRWDSCLTEQFHSLEPISPKNTMRSITLRIVFGDADENHIDVALRSGSVKIKGDLDPSILSNILQRLGVWEIYSNA